MAEAARPTGGTDAGPGGGIVDFHNHIIPDVDDGATDESETKHAISALSREGVTAIIATPHVRLFAAGQGSVAERLDEIDVGWNRLRECAGEAVPIRRGAELRLDTADPDLADPRLRLGGGRFALVEFPYFAIPPRSSRVLSLIAKRGWTPIVAHPERYSGMDPALDVVREWRESGALLQVNAGSVLGRYGEGAAAIAYALLRHGLVDYIASDYHARGLPRVAEALGVLERSGAAAQAQLLSRTNPARLWRDEMPLAVPPAALEGLVLERKRPSGREGS
jgi:protein-tyrosine phosphatase